MQSNTTAMHMSIPELWDEPIDASKLVLAFRHRDLLYHQSTQTQGGQKPLIHPKQVTDLTLRIIAPTANVIKVIADNCPDLRTLTIYDGVDFEPRNRLEVPCRFAPDWAKHLPHLHAIEKLTYTWTLDTPHDCDVEDPGGSRGTRGTTRWDEDAERRAVSVLAAASPNIQEIVFAVFRPFTANQENSAERQVVWRKQSSAGWVPEVWREVEL